MLRIAQAFDSRQWSVIASASVKAMVVTAALSLAGCGAGGFSLEKIDVDRSIVTSSTPSSSAAPATADKDSDQTTIGNAVSSADIKELGGQPVPWANAGTGSRGAITELVELKDGGLTCRRFSATRESFDGVALYKGELCLAGAGGWRMQEFKAL
ncbi:RT0821/Lpp0805 family surface protein [Mesorhizobium sp. WSM4935]|uniref:RT0821/Lpp0805 family surface protein n=1 Tax=Mesorhizobium sp. WSM4935 TaxID=3038547 RepID=UPI002414D095|nr:RT0821/Lpp0805 family surface protein [Mesorhizobium sp. WSM4935]MDG4876546.1 RT0821/Lpp0805 family surface protein [Mesorhizobium sp. WSM4935]